MNNRIDDLCIDDLWNLTYQIMERIQELMAMEEKCSPYGTFDGEEE